MMASINKSVWTAALLSCVAMVYMLLGMHYHGMALAGAIVAFSVFTAFAVMVLITGAALYAVVAAIFDGGHALAQQEHRM
jgi:uncharacterized Tic20 family protein